MRLFLSHAAVQIVMLLPDMLTVRSCIILGMCCFKRSASRLRMSASRINLFVWCRFLFVRYGGRFRLWYSCVLISILCYIPVLVPECTPYVCSPDYAQYQTVISTVSKYSFRGTLAVDLPCYYVSEEPLVWRRQRYGSCSRSWGPSKRCTQCVVDPIAYNT